MNQHNLHLQDGGIPFFPTLLLMPTEISSCSLLVDLPADLPEVWVTPGTAKEPSCVDKLSELSLIWDFFICNTPLWSCAHFWGYIANQLLSFVSKIVVRDLFIQLPLMLLHVSS